MTSGLGDNTPGTHKNARYSYGTMSMQIALDKSRTSAYGTAKCRAPWNFPRYLRNTFSSRRSRMLWFYESFFPWSGFSFFSLAIKGRQYQNPQRLDRLRSRILRVFIS